MAESDDISILLVDDQDSRLLSYEAILGDLRRNLVRASSGKEALARLMKEDFAVILLDVNMPVMDGFETARLIRQHPRYEATPIIFVTAVHDTEFDQRRGYQMGAVDYIQIPIVPEILRSKVAVLVELYDKRRDLKRLNLSLERANEDLAQANRALEADKTKELARLNAALARTNEELTRTNSALKAEIGERHRAEDALKDASRRKDEFLAVLAHELRNPLAPIRNSVEILKLTSDKATLSMAQATIERQIRHMARLVDDLLDVSRITQGRIEMHREQADLRAILEGALEATRPLLEGAGQNFALEIMEGPLPIDGDAARLAQVVSNIVNNASKFSEREATIRISVAREKTTGVITIQDHGCGIPASFLPRVFDMFTQADRSLERSKGGLGIGLALSRRIVEMHGGSIEARSDGAGLGATVEIRLPLSSEQPSEIPARETVTLLRGTKRRVLVADDNADSAQTMSRMLELLGYEVFSALDGEQALQAVTSIRPEVVLLDIGMPRMNGYSAARRIRELCGQEVVLIAVTGWGQPEDRRRAMEVGFNAHLTKPITPADLQKLIEHSTRKGPNLNA